jgi:hypothetical protein
VVGVADTDEAKKGSMCEQEGGKGSESAHLESGRECAAGEKIRIQGGQEERAASSGGVESNSELVEYGEAEGVWEWECTSGVENQVLCLCAVSEDGFQVA